MTEQEILHRGLPKWPGCVIVGEPVTPEQAAEIIIRTDRAVPDPCCNDTDWCRQLCNVMGVSYWLDVDRDRDFEASRAEWVRKDAVRESVGHLTLEYLCNSQIASAYIGGPHGWCNWDGHIGSHTTNIGKWPSCEEVYEEWQRIAEAFPYLRLKCQLMDREQCEEGYQPVIEYHVEGGKVAVHDPKGEVLKPMASDIKPESLWRIGFIANAANPRERGCTLEQFTKAFEAVKAKCADA